MKQEDDFEWFINNRATDEQLYWLLAYVVLKVCGIIALAAFFVAALLHWLCP